VTQAEFVFSESPITPNDVGVRLNRDKCRDDDFKDWNFEVELLGSYIRPNPEVFLQKKLDKEMEVLARLDRIPAHHAQLLLRWSIQHRLRHLLRTMNTTAATTL